ncbi:hypothetical protein [Amycolatopsis xylanica]|nr:hypothetical protein [Amycolatopsis xylanica]
MRARVALVTAMAGLLLAGCQVSVTGSAGVSAADQQKADRRAEQRDAVETALKTFADQPIAVYHGTAKDSAGAPVDLTLRVTKAGTSLGTLLLDNQGAQLVIADGKLYLSAGAGYWKSRGIKQELGDLYAKGWAKAEASELPVNPATLLVPAKAAEKIRATLSTVDQLAEPVRTKLPDGTEVFDIKTPTGSLQVSTAKPNRLVSVAAAAIDPAAAGALGTQLTIDPAAPDVAKKFHDDLNAKLDAFGQPADSVAQASAAIADHKFDCNSGNASCTTTVTVANVLVGGDSSGSQVHLVLTVQVTAEGLAGQNCSAEATAAPNTSSTMACTVKFNLPNRTANYKVLSQPSATADVRAAIDFPALKGKLDTEFKAIGG